jgi:hypothetical protein
MFNYAVDWAKKRYHQEYRHMVRLWRTSWNISPSITAAAAILICGPCLFVGFVIGKQMSVIIINNNIPTRTTSAAPGKVPEWAFNSDISNDELKRRTAIITARLRKFQEGHSEAVNALVERSRPLITRGGKQEGPEWDRFNNQLLEINYRYQAEADQQFRSDALALRDIIERRIGRLVARQPTSRTIWLDSNSIAGPHALSDAADYLDELARALPL